jgi:mannose-1-phosphate guanylyltransferase/mannose-6-phosphate isomerase
MIPVVLSGGSGTWLWPLSRAQFPKQFCELLDESLLEKTLRRVRVFGSPWTITVRELNDLTMRVFRSQTLPAEQIIFEPTARNTAPAIALLCRVMELRGSGEEIVGVFPADHLVTDEEAFNEAVTLAQQAARAGFVATLGIKPDHPSTGFGYIETRPKIQFTEKILAAYDVAGFREKPDRATAEQFLEKGNFFWNAGIFVFKVSTMIANFQALMPELWKVMLELKKDLSNLDDVYKRAPSQSIDYGIMEKLKQQVCIPCDIGWSDLGSWDDVARFHASDQEVKIANHAHVVSTGSRDCFVYSDREKVYGLVDVEDLILVDTEDALLLSRKGRTQNVRDIVQNLTKQAHAVAREHRFELRPWGRYTVLRDEAHYKSKVLVIDAGQAISYQSHTKRNEHWVVVRGEGEVTLDATVRTIRTGDTVHIPAGMKHRLRNSSTAPLEILEVQTGTYFGEDDITRYQDDYNRTLTDKGVPGRG